MRTEKVRKYVFYGDLTSQKAEPKIREGKIDVGASFPLPNRKIASSQKKRRYSANCPQETTHNTTRHTCHTLTTLTSDRVFLAFPQLLSFFFFIQQLKGASLFPVVEIKTLTRFAAGYTYHHPKLVVGNSNTPKKPKQKNKQKRKRFFL